MSRLLTPVWVILFPSDSLILCFHDPLDFNASCSKLNKFNLLLLDEPSSSSHDRDNAHVIASAVISSTPVITTIPPSPTSPCPIIRRQLSHDQGEKPLYPYRYIKTMFGFVFLFLNWSYVDSLRLTFLESDSGAKTERSRSFDEGLDNYREEERGWVTAPVLF